MGAAGDITTEQVDKAIDYVIENGAVDRALTVSYSRVFEAAGSQLDALVVHVAGSREGKPGVGYFRINKVKDPFGERPSAGQKIEAWQLWESQQRECRAWGIRRRRGEV
ncbi:hypothetical protein [Amycolatopsis sp. NPDC059657]|uniref:hypothetical protein n=1 Tax=Amycolatopsis sp. NPDC059657 TaxID=3346899 RepID=UPI00366F7CF5